MTTKLNNTFHNTSTSVRLTRNEMDAIEARAALGDAESRRRMRKVAEKLCPSKWHGCTCSNGWGERY